jgi:anti-sigma B factor antagonist
MADPASRSVSAVIPVHVWRITLHGEIDVATAPNMFAHVMAADPKAGDVVTFDLRDVEFIDSSGISMLLQVGSYLDAMGCQLTLANPSDPVTRVLAVLAVTEQFAVDDG